MILDKIVSISIGCRNMTYYKKKGYDIKLNDIIDIKIEDLDKESTCKVNVKCDNCDNQKMMEYRHYNNNLKKYDVYLCNKCKHIKSKKTKLELYGDENYNNIEKNRNTCIEKYGVEHYNKLDYFKMKIKKTKLELYSDENYSNVEKGKKTKLELYGDENYNNIEKNRNTCIEKYGEDNIFKVDYYKQKNIISRKNRLIKMYKQYNLLDIDYENYLYICECVKKHKFEIPKTIFYNRIKTKTTLCTICNPIGNLQSDKECKIFDFIKDNYDKEIIQNSRDIIKPYEIDIYLPDIKIAFEFNGLYWHNELNKPNNYHLTKTEMCEKQNIRLIHIYEDEWLFKQEIIKSRILNILGKTPEKIYARKCEIRIIDDNNNIKKFLEENHLQGFVGSKIKLGLFHENVLVSLMTFGNLRKAMGSKSKINSFELLRFCNKINTNVIGAANKLFNFFINNYEYNEIISFANRSWSNGNLYQILNFKFDKKTPPNYYYIINNMRYHRFNFRKDKLIKDGYDQNKTEHEIMLERKMYKIYDSGNLKFIYKKN